MECYILEFSKWPEFSLWPPFFYSFSYFLLKSSEFVFYFLVRDWSLTFCSQWESHAHQIGVNDVTPLNHWASTPHSFWKGKKENTRIKWLTSLPWILAKEVSLPDTQSCTHDVSKVARYHYIEVTETPKKRAKKLFKKRNENNGKLGENDTQEPGSWSPLRSNMREKVGYISFYILGLVS